MLSINLEKIRNRTKKLQKISAPRIKKEKAVGMMLTAWNCLAVSQRPAMANEDTAKDNHKKVLLVSHGGYMSCAAPNKNVMHRIGPIGLKLDDTLLSDSEKNSKDRRPTPPSVEGSFTHLISVGDCKIENSDGTVEEESPCSSRKRPWFKKSVKEALEEKGYEVDWVVSCYAMNPDTVYMLDSEKPEEQLSTDRASMWNKIKKMAGTVGRILVVGHSYGGWTAMKTVMELERPVDQLMTLDPISVEHCTPAKYLGGSDDCMRFPRDFDTEKQLVVGEKTNIWKHYWQEITKPSGWQLGLHSGALSLGDDQVLQRKLDFGHSEIHDQQEIWDDFVSSFDSELSIAQ